MPEMRTAPLLEAVAAYASATGHGPEDHLASARRMLEAIPGELRWSLLACSGGSAPAEKAWCAVAAGVAAGAVLDTSRGTPAGMPHAHAVHVFPLLLASTRAWLLGSAPLQAPLATEELRAILNLASLLSSAISAPEKCFNELNHADKLAQLGRTVASVAHELNGPLQAIISEAETLAASAHDQNFDGSLQRILRSGLRCRGIVQDLLACGTPRPATLRAVSVSNAIMEAMDLDRWSDVGDVQVELANAEALPPVLADEARLIQVFTNLISNARQASGAAGTREPVRIHLARVGTQLEIRVTDRGRGVDPVVRPRLFEPFVTDQEDGHGLGLWLSRRMVEECGGNLRHDASWSPGAAFVVSLPVAEAQAPEHHEVVAARVLVIDDDRELLDTYEALLRLDGHVVTTTDRASAALEQLAHGHFDVVLCDLRLPDMTGAAFFAEVQRRWPAVAPRIVFATGDVGRAESVAFLASVRNTVLVKPFRAEDLAQAIERVRQLN